MSARALLLILMVACKRDDAAIGKTPEKPKTGSTKKLASAPKEHRPEHAKCQLADTPPPKTVTFKPQPPQPPGPPCATRADCKAGKGARCDAGHCVYDECTSDADCGKGPCECVDHTDHGTKGHYCRTGNCAVDSDCPAGYCAPSLGFECGSYSGIKGYYCRTADDECLNDADCKNDKGDSGYCAYDEKKDHWLCGYTHCEG